MHTPNYNQRFVTLDVFRGMTVFLMIVVNTQGSLAAPYAILEHADWNGCTLADLVFPSFLFAVGNAMAFSGKKFESLPEASVWYRIMKRTALIFIIGYLLSWYPFIGWNGEGHIWQKPFGETRLLSVLQRIALTYCISALLVYYASLRVVITWCVLLLIGYWAILYFGGDPGMQYTLMGNAVRKTDLLLIGPHHMYKEKGIAFDPEGILSTLPAIVNVLAGYLTGRFLVKEGKTYRTILHLLIIAGALLIISMTWSFVLPLNKKLWTSSYVLFTTAIDLVVVTLLFYLIEMKNIQWGVYFFNVFGRNPFLIYVLSNVIGIFLVFYVAPGTVLIDWVNREFFQRIAPGAFGCLLFSVAFTMLCWMVGWWLDRRKVYVRI